MKYLISILKKHLDIIFLFIVPAFVFLPYVNRLTYYLDDWYYVYNSVVAGSNIFHPMFNVDRPARGYFFDLYFSLFGPQPFPYHLGMYLWHVLAGCATLWLFHLLWPYNRKFNFIAALFFILYPGFSWWVSGVEYQPMMVSLALMAFSFVFTLKNIEIISPIRWLYLTGAILTGWGYISLVEYAIGMEGMRFLIVYIYLYKRQNDLHIISKLWIWIGNLIISASFSFWRIFLFDNQRKATDISIQLNPLQQTPLETFQKWFDSFLYSFINVNEAWFTQFKYQYASSGIQLTQEVWIMVVIVIILILFFLFQADQQHSSAVIKNKSSNSSKEMIAVGFFCLIIGLLPIIFANRFINLTFYSHYSLPISLPSAMFLAGIIQYLFRFRIIQYSVISGIVVFAMLAHFFIAEKTIFLKETVEDFWWQAYWRMPALRPDATLVTQYPDGRVVDNKYGLPEPVNLIYFPESQTELPIRYLVSTLMPYQENIDNILIGRGKKKDGYRVYEFVPDFQNILLLSQPSFQSCVHVVDGTNYLLSQYEAEVIHDIASRSNISNIKVEAPQQILPPFFAFGPEPIHGWCYYYQKASLALQRSDFKQISLLSDKVREEGLYPIDKSEWFPFFIAYLEQQDIDNLNLVFKDIKSDIELLDEFCILSQNELFAFKDNILTVKSYCKSK